MASNLALDPKLLEHALKVSGERTKKAAISVDIGDSDIGDSAFNYRVSPLRGRDRLGACPKSGEGPRP